MTILLLFPHLEDDHYNIISTEHLTLYLSVLGLSSTLTRRCIQLLSPYCREAGHPYTFVRAYIRPWVE